MTDQTQAETEANTAIITAATQGRNDIVTRVLTDAETLQASGTLKPDQMAPFIVTAIKTQLESKGPQQTG